MKRFIKVLFLLQSINITMNSSPLVAIRSKIPSILVDLPYATADNFTRSQVYPDCADAYALAEVIEQLALVQEYLKQKGFGLKIWDAYRPLAAQYKFWELVPDERYVSNPAKGGGRHTRGTTVDVTLVTLDGQEVAMPTEFDNFTEQAHADYQDFPDVILAHREILREAMERFGFKGLATEWWHFDLVGWQKYPALALDFEDLAKAEY
ncbi:MAG: M15 family metallopeptidase [Candidatus Babeliales bacterium]